jgi:two-component system chemotaxis sensor kinase CheA
MEMIRDFVNEGRELLDDAEPQIIEMEKTALSSGKVDEDVLNGIFRLFHSLKGTASFLDFQAIIGVTHEAETLLDIFRKGGIMVTPYQVDLLCRTTDFVRLLLDEVESRQSDTGFEEDTARLVDDLKQAIAAISGGDEPRKKQPSPARDPSRRRAPSPGEEEHPSREPPSGPGLLALEQDAPEENHIPSPGEEQPATPGPLPGEDLPAETPRHPESGDSPDFPGHVPDAEDTPPAPDPPSLEQDAPTGESYAPTPNLEEMGLRITPEMIRSFAEEALELCEDAETALLSLERAPDAESAGRAFRAFHSIKGNSGFFGYQDLEHLSHLAENLLDRIRSKERSCDPAAASALLKAIDAIRSKVHDVAGSGSGGIPDLEQLCRSLTELADDSREPDPAATRPAPAPKKDTPGSSLAEELEKLRDGEAPPAEPPAPEQYQEPLPAPGAPPAASIRSPGSPASPGAPPAAASTRSPGSGGAVIRVDIDKLDKMLDLVGELVIAESMVAGSQSLALDQSDRFTKAVLQLDKISREIQEVAMSMRMIPLAGVFRKMMRLVRDLAQKANKQVDLAIIGEDTEVDKTLIEQISDPLVHLIRNAVDHGIEPVAERLDAGKPETGRVTIEARHSAGEVWITVEDDGKGLSRDKILQKGLEKGLIKPGDREMKDEEIWQLIFEPGFSTAEQVSSISGRGVGMDVVKQNIEHLRGKIDIRSKPGVGTIFAIRIPLTLAIIEGMVVRVGKSRYTIPISSIKESFRPSPGQITRAPDGLEIVRIRGELQPVLRLHELYRVEPRCRDLSEGILIMVENSENKCCLFVDELLGQQQIVIKGLPGYLRHVKGISGCAILGDGEISMILDIADLVSSVQDIS